MAKNASSRSDLDRPGPTTARITMWICGGAVGLYMVVSGLIGALTTG
ncbi:hypothetical protein ACIGEP_02985 [Microbacterium sp. NPDC077663]